MRQADARSTAARSRGMNNAADAVFAGAMDVVGTVVAVGVGATLFTLHVVDPTI
jgi:hypothetical protein